MSELILIRHGQATPFEKDTDQLSELGQRQARAVGAFLAESQPTHIIHGPLVRQRRSAEIASAEVARAEVAAEGAGQGRSWPAPALDPRLAEFDGDGLMNTLAPKLAQQDPQFAELIAAFQAKRHTPQRNAAFQRMLEALADAWQAGTVSDSQVESWAAFRSRVRGALGDLLRLPSGSRVLAFTSGGVIGLIVAASLDAPDAAALKLNWRVKNGSLTRLTFGAGRISLDTFNEEAHLPAELQSWR